MSSRISDTSSDDTSMADADMSRISISEVNIGKVNIKQVNMSLGNVNMSNVSSHEKSSIAPEDNRIAQTGPPDLNLNNLFSPGPWYRMYVGRISDEEDTTAESRECWVAHSLGEDAFYHQPEGGVRSDYKSPHWGGYVIKESIPKLLLIGNYGEDWWFTAEEVAGLKFDAITGYRAEHTTSCPRILIWQMHQHVQEAKEKSNQNQLPRDEPIEPLPERYSQYTCLGASEPAFPASEENDIFSDGTYTDEWGSRLEKLERKWFDFERNPKFEEFDMFYMAEILQRRFDTSCMPKPGLVENMRWFGETNARLDPRKVFEFYEWVEWLAADRRNANANA